MAQIIVFHHAQGLTDGIRQFVGALEAEGHTVLTPDMFHGQTFPTVEAGVAHAEKLTFDVAFSRAAEAVAKALSDGGSGSEPVFYVGFSMGAIAAAQHALEDPNAKGLILMHAAVDPEWFPQPWPRNLFAQVHASEEDPWMEFDALEALREATIEFAPVDVHIYPGSAHLFSDPSVSAYNAEHAHKAFEQVIAFVRNHS